MSTRTHSEIIVKPGSGRRGPVDNDTYVGQHFVLTVPPASNKSVTVSVIDLEKSFAAVGIQCKDQHPDDDQNRFRGDLCLL